MGGRMRPGALVLLAVAALAVMESEDREGGSLLPSGEQEMLGVAEGIEAGKITIDVTGKSAEKKTGAGFAWIPNFVMKHMAQELNVKSQAACEAVCIKHDDCRSYSYRAKDKLCVWSIQALQYHYDWAFYTKVHEMDAFGKMKHGGKYRKFDGIMYQEPGYKRYKNKTVQKCEKLCNKAPKCKAFSYHEAGERCYLTDAGIQYDEKKNAKPAKSPTQLEDEQEALQNQEVAAKKAKSDRILASIRARKIKSARTAREMRAKQVIRETLMKKKLKKMAETRLAKEKASEKHDKRMARMKSAYNEGYFKNKGVVAEKKRKEKEIKALRASEKKDKNKRVIAAERKKKEKLSKEKAKKAKERATKKDLLATKERLVKLKNKEIKTEIAKEEKVLDIAKNLALTKTELHEESIERDKKKKRSLAEKENKKVKEMRIKATAANKSKKRELKKLEVLRKQPLKVKFKVATKVPPTGKRKGKSNAGKRKGK